MDENDSFQNLKQNILPLVKSTSDLEILKIHFDKEIASKRASNKIKTFSDLLEILDNRNCFSATDVTILLSIADVLNNDAIRTLVKTFKKLEGLNDSSSCWKCSLTNTLQLVPVERPKCTDSALGNEQKQHANDLEEVIENVSENIGPGWRVLLRELDIPEGYINEIRKNYRNNAQLQPKCALKLWREIKGSEATKAKLENALNSRLCKQKGFGSHLMLPSIKLSICT